MDGVALKGLTVDFHEPDFVSTLNSENQQPFWFEMSREQKQQAGSPWGPANPQALNRYAYVQNNPLKWTDPSGHCPVCAAIGWVFTAAGFTVSAPVVVGVAAVLGVAALAVFLSDETNRAWLAEQISSGISNVDSFVEQLSGVTVHEGDGSEIATRVGAGSPAHIALMASVTKLSRWRCC
jgi:hypothetical protein